MYKYWKYPNRTKPNHILQKLHDKMEKVNPIR